MSHSPLKPRGLNEDEENGVEASETLSKLMKNFTIGARPAEIAKGKRGLHRLPGGTDYTFHGCPRTTLKTLATLPSQSRQWGCVRAPYYGAHHLYPQSVAVAVAASDARC